MKPFTTVVIIIATAITLLMLTACGGHYSDGTRVGTITKFSKKGLVFKSWEGEMNLGGMSRSGDGAVPTTFRFSVPDLVVAMEVQDALNAGKPVRVTYSQWVIAPWTQDSDYVITSVKTLPN